MVKTRSVSQRPGINWDGKRNILNNSLVRHIVDASNLNYRSDVIKAVLGPVPKEKPGMVRPTVTGEILRRNGGKLPKNLAPKRVDEVDVIDADAASTISDASITTGVSMGAKASTSAAKTRRPFSVEVEPEDKFYTKVDIYGATRIPKNDVLYVANYMEYIATEAVLEQPVSRLV